MNKAMKGLAIGGFAALILTVVLPVTGVFLIGNGKLYADSAISHVTDEGPTGTSTVVIGAAALEAKSVGDSGAAIDRSSGLQSQDADIWIECPKDGYAAHIKYGDDNGRLTLKAVECVKDDFSVTGN